jgi:hypothetical protein
VANRFFVVVVGILALGLSALGQSTPSIQGVWRPVEVTITNDNPNPNPNAFGKGTHTNLQPALVIFAGKHYSQVVDTAAKPRPTTPFKVQQKPTPEEMQTHWGPFAAFAGTYELAGTTLTTRVTVGKNPVTQGKGFLRSTIKLDGQNLWITGLENINGKIANPSTIKYVRVE